MNSVWLVNLGLVPYADALALQHRLVEARKRGKLNDTLLLLEHPPVFTLGRNANDSNIVASPDFLKQLGIEIFKVERGGDVTITDPGNSLAIRFSTSTTFGSMSVGSCARSKKC